MLKNCCGLIVFQIFLLLMLSANDACAQKFSIGARAGILTTWPAFGDKEAKEIFSRRLKLGYSTGILIDFPLKDKYNVIFEGGYSRRGRRLTYYADGDLWENNTNYYYTDLAMLFRKSFPFRFSNNAPGHWFVNVGPEVNYWLSAKGKFVIFNTDYPYEGIFHQEPTGDFRKMYFNDINQWQFSLLVGGGIKAPLRKNHHIVAELRFVSGHTFLGEQRSTYIQYLEFRDTMKVNLKSFALSASYMIDIDIQESRKGKSTIKKRMKKQ